MKKATWTLEPTQQLRLPDNAARLLLYGLLKDLDEEIGVERCKESMEAQLDYLIGLTPQQFPPGFPSA